MPAPNKSGKTKMMKMRFNLPPEVFKFLEGAEVVRDRVGESPARVYAVRRGNDRFFLKFSHRLFSSTTYSVGREAGVLQWLWGKVSVPEVLLYAENATWQCMITRAVPGKPLSDFTTDENRCVEAFAEAIRQLQTISIADCRFDSRISVRLAELDELLRMGKIDREADLSVYPGVRTPEDLVSRLKSKTFVEDLVFSHGDLGDSNLFLDDRDRISFIDLGRGGVADRWMDIAFACQNLAHEVSEPAVETFLSRLGVSDQPERRKYFEMLDELF